MTENNPLEILFAAGMSKEQFITKYNELKETESQKDNTSSIFKTDLSYSIEALYDTIDKKHDNNVDESELAEFKSYDNSDGENTLSESDIAVLYDKTLKNISAQRRSGTPEDMYKTAVSDGGTTPTTVGEDRTSAYITELSSQISSISELINARQNESNSKLSRYQAELDNLIINESNLSREEKDFYEQGFKQTSRIFSREITVRNVNCQ